MRGVSFDRDFFLTDTRVVTILEDFLESLLSGSSINEIEF